MDNIITYVNTQYDKMVVLAWNSIRPKLLGYPSGIQLSDVVRYALSLEVDEEEMFDDLTTASTFTMHLMLSEMKLIENDIDVIIEVMTLFSMRAGDRPYEEQYHHWKRYLTQPSPLIFPLPPHR